MTKAHLPPAGTKEFVEIVEKWAKTKTSTELNDLALSLGYSGAESLSRQLRSRGVHRTSMEQEIKLIVEEKKLEIPPIPKIELRPPPVQEEREKEEVQVLLLSDTQFGLRTKTYNSKIAAKRMARLYNATCRFADIHRKFCPIGKLVVFVLGDIPEGELIGRQVSLDELEMTLHDQKWFAVNEISTFLINACQWYAEIEVVCVAGNHGIMGRYFSFATNWNIEIYDLLKATVTPNYPQVKFTIVADDFYAVHKVVNTKFLALHGDKIPMYLSLPFYGIDRRSLKWKQSLPDWDILVMGHFHSASFLQPSGLPIFINGTVCSDSRYVAQWIGVREIAEQWTMFVGEKYGVTAMHKIDLMREDG